MNEKQQRLTELKTRQNAIISRGKYIDSPGVLKKVTRAISRLEKELK
jgi:hypothetical protein